MKGYETMSDDLPEADERQDDLAVRFLERSVNIWTGKGLPLPVIARAMIGFGTSCVEASQGHGMAVEMIDEIRTALEDNRPSRHLAS